ncbi:MAG: hypothetical protein R3F49_12280 [Planctomycetota bacterium]
MSLSVRHRRSLSSLRVPALCAAVLGATPGPLLAQWSSDPSANLAVGDAPSDQNLAKLAATADGGTWVSWLDGIGSGWDVRVQRLEADGVERFAHNGLLVADRAFSSTQDYGLDLDVNGDALLAFRDTRPGGTQVTAALVTGAGAQPWGAAGVVLTNTTAFIGSPKIAGTSDGGAVVAWTEDSDLRLQKLDAAGAPLWGAGVTLTPAAGSYSVADLRADGTDVVVGFVHATGGFTAPRHLRAQRFDAAGAALWGAPSLAVFDGGSLQIGNFPSFSLDASGAALFAWYSSSPALQCYVQRVDAAGVEQFAHNGVAVATTAGRVRVNPDAAFDAATGDVYVAWREQNGTQSQQGVSAQRIDAAGARLWSDDGLTLVALGGPVQDLVRVVLGGGGALVAWSTAPTFGTDVLGGAHVTAAGVVDVPRFDIASTPSQKMRLVATKSRVGAGQALLAWTDARGDGDIYAQSVGFDGTLGGSGVLTTNYCGPAAVNSSGLSATISAFGSPFVAHDNLSLRADGLALNAFAYFIVSRTQGFVVMPGGSQGNLCLSGSIGRNVGGVIMNSGPSGAVSVMAPLTTMPLPTGPVAVAPGETWNFQCWFRDSVGGSATSNFSDALSLTFL